jgi:lipopolysaccharide biosynthesis protein
MRSSDGIFYIAFKYRLYKLLSIISPIRAHRVLFREKLKKYKRKFSAHLGVLPYGKVIEQPEVKGVDDSEVSEFHAREYKFIVPEQKPSYQDEATMEIASDVRVISFFLPQFHRIPENDLWWGKGFTEWTNTRKAKPRFDGHYQPRTPHGDIGYYDLSQPETLSKQAGLAKRHGIYGFCFYYYWFSGKTLLEKPLEILLDHPEIDLPFCLCWANENWTRRWDGWNSDILMKQEYNENDPISFIDGLAKYMKDGRYIRIDGKPLLLVYRPKLIPDIDRVFKCWRKRAEELGIGELMIWTTRAFGDTASEMGILHLIDGEVEFPPHVFFFLKGPSLKVVNEEFNEVSGVGFDYAAVVDDLISRNHGASDVPLYKTCMMQFDNSSRKAVEFVPFVNYSLGVFYKWLRHNIEYTEQNNRHQYTFINAWNEWAEGTYLEPDEEYGYANINTVSKALSGEPLREDIIIVPSGDSTLTCEAKEARTALHIHIYYPGLIEEILKYLNNMPYPYDCFISTDSDLKADEIRYRFAGQVSARNTFVEVFSDRGKDVGPFIQQMRDAALEYEYIGNIHTKESSLYGISGQEWRRYLLSCLLGSEDHVRHIFANFEANEKLGMIVPENFHKLHQLGNLWGANYSRVVSLLSDVGIKQHIYDYEPFFPAENMFWARTAAIRNIFLRRYSCNDFEEEKGQIDGTLAHVIERSWCYVAISNGFHCVQVRKLQNAAQNT